MCKLVLGSRQAPTKRKFMRAVDAFSELVLCRLFVIFHSCLQRRSTCNFDLRNAQETLLFMTLLQLLLEVRSSYEAANRFFFQYSNKFLFESYDS